MSHSDADSAPTPSRHASASEKLRADILTTLKPLAAAVRAIQNTQAEVREDGGEFLDACQAALRAVLAVEGLEKVAEAVKDDLRTLLAGALEMGPGIVRSETHTASIGSAKRSVIITGDVPEIWMSSPKPTPDKRRIGEVLDKGQTLPFATLSNGGAPVLTIKTRKD